MSSSHSLWGELIIIRTSKTEPYGIKHRVGVSDYFLSKNDKFQSRKIYFGEQCEEDQILN